jgi:hypothetical protein
VIAVRRLAGRAVTKVPGVTMWHGFSAGAHYDPANTHFGRLVTHDLHALEPGAGFGRHSHRELEIVSWVLTGTLLHVDPSGGATAVRHGTVQHITAGSGVVHEERNAGAHELRFVQMWLVGEPGEPAYRTGAVDVGDARFRVVRGPARLDAAPFVHVFVASGTAGLDGVELDAGDEVRITGEAVTLRGDAELLVWEMQRPIAGARR